MSQTVDTNVLLYASNRDAPEHERALALLDHLAEDTALVVLLWPTLLSYLRLATHPTIVPRPLEPRTAVANVEALLDRPNVRAVGEGPGFWPTYRAVTDEVTARGNLVPDAHLVALMREHGVGTVWSRDRDFRKFSGLTVKDPFIDRYDRGFDS